MQENNYTNTSNSWKIKLRSKNMYNSYRFKLKKFELFLADSKLSASHKGHSVSMENMTILYISDLLRKIYIGNLNSAQLSDSRVYITISDGKDMNIILIDVIIKTVFTSVNNVINYFDIVPCTCYTYYVVYFS